MPSSRGVCSAIGLLAVRVGCGWPPGDPGAAIIRPGFIAISGQNWRAAFARYVESLGTFPVYVTVDLDSLRESEAVTNWENGRFSLSDIVWAISLLRQKRRIIGGDLCGAFSQARYGSRFQTLAGRFDHPRQRSVSEDERRTVNLQALKVIWPKSDRQGG